MNIISQYQLILKLLQISKEVPDPTHAFELQELAMDVAGILPDNTESAKPCDAANDTGKWPIWGTCRDAIYEELGNCENADQMLGVIMHCAQQSPYSSVAIGHS